MDWLSSIQARDDGWVTSKLSLQSEKNYSIFNSLIIWYNTLIILHPTHHHHHHVFFVYGQQMITTDRRSISC